MDTFKIGDLVRLKSGGPVMSVKSSIMPLLNEEGIYCQWFDDKKKLNQGHFKPEQERVFFCLLLSKARCIILIVLYPCSAFSDSGILFTIVL